MASMLDLFDELRGVVTRLDEVGVPYALCGGLAMAVHGLPRATVDIDLLALAEDFARIEEAIRPLGVCAPRSADDVSRRRGRDQALVEDPATGQFLSLDVLLVTPETTEASNTRQEMEWEFGRLTVVSREGLIALKSLRGSGRDRDDIDQLLGKTE